MSPEPVDNLKRMQSIQTVGLLRASGGDWIGLYVDGKLVDEGHSLDERMVLEALGIQPQIVEETRTENLEPSYGRCPSAWYEVERDYA